MLQIFLKYFCWQDSEIFSFDLKKNEGHTPQLTETKLKEAKTELFCQWSEIVNIIIHTDGTKHQSCWHRGWPK